MDESPPWRISETPAVLAAGSSRGRPVGAEVTDDTSEHRRQPRFPLERNGCKRWSTGDHRYAQRPRPPKSTRGQIALWMLTKFAMVFFIIMLAAILVSFSDTQKQAICRTQAQAMARNIAATMANVINSPAEDERKVFALESSLSVGKSQLERYTINITNVPSDRDLGSGSLVVHVRSGSGCEGYARAAYDPSIVLANPETLLSRWQAKQWTLLKPSDVTRRDYYLIMVKCRPKQNSASNYLYIKSCSESLGVLVNPDSCDPKLNSSATISLDARLQNPVLQCCGWEALQDVPTTSVPGKQPGRPLCPS